MRAYVGVGSNVAAEANVPAALRALARRVRVVATSTFYRTEPIGRAGDPPFVNGVVAVDAELAAADLKWRVLRPIEAELGRLRGPDPNAPRTIDLDLLLYGEVRCATPELVLPDPQIVERPFLAWPLLELDPELVLPDGRPLHPLAERLPRAGMTALPALTARLRAEVADG